ncbi:HAD family hydrolase [Streptomyces sp. WAC 04229]|uniref:HAD family hydrolase n=1 Tax=Streptomyces sp. WAC 04229 TaxID=2203206 RepID=UPI003D72A11E
MGKAIDGTAALLAMLRPVQAVLFDFDGPVCDLFKGASTSDVADRIKENSRRYWNSLDSDVRTCNDSHGILRLLRDMYERPTPMVRDPKPLALAEEIVAAQEMKAVRSAAPTPEFTELIGALGDLGMRTVIVSNNAEGPIRDYLERRGMHDHFEAVCGRDPEDARRMKPHPDCVRRALAHLSLPADACLLVGDQITDLKAAQQAGTRFLGFTRDEVCAKEMWHHGAEAVVSSHLPLIEAARTLAGGRPPLTVKR